MAGVPERGGHLLLLLLLLVAIRAWRSVYDYFLSFVAERGEHFFSYGVLLDARMKQLKSAEAMYGRAIELAPQV